MKLFFIFLFLTILTKNGFGQLVNAVCDQSTCPTGCCKNDNTCTTDISACRLVKNYDFKNLENPLIALFAFIVGILFQFKYILIVDIYLRIPNINLFIGFLIYEESFLFDELL